MSGSRLLINVPLVHRGDLAFCWINITQGWKGDNYHAQQKEGAYKYASGSIEVISFFLHRTADEVWQGSSTSLMHHNGEESLKGKKNCLQQSGAWAAAAREQPGRNEKGCTNEIRKAAVVLFSPLPEMADKGAAKSRGEIVEGKL